MTDSRTIGSPVGIGFCGLMNENNVQGESQTRLGGCLPLPHQVAGHKYGVNKVGILQHPDGTVLKQLQPPPRGPRERQFYSMVFAEDCSDPHLLDLQHYLPKYYGAWSFSDSPNDLYLKLEDVTHKFHKPCIMDVKMGQQSYDPYAPKEKRERHVRKYPLMEEIGFLVLGMRVFQMSSDSYQTLDQLYGRSLEKDTAKDGLAKFFHNGNGLRKDAITNTIQKVQKILQWFESQKQLHFYASSLLFVYEGSPQQGDPKPVSGCVSEKATIHGEEGGELEHKKKFLSTGPSDNGDEKAAHNGVLTGGHGGDVPANILNTQQNNNVFKRTTPVSLTQTNDNNVSSLLEQEASLQETGMEQKGNKVEVRMIDFAHVFPSKTRDEGYIYGLKSLLWRLQQILHE